MAKFLNTSATNYFLEEMIKSASDRLILISPFLKLNDRMKELAEGCRKEYGVSSDDPYGLKLTACLQAIEPMIKQLQENKSERIIELARRSDAFVQDDLPRLQTLALA